MRPHPKQTSAQPTRNLRTIPQPQRVELLGKLVQFRQAYPLTTEQTLDAGRRTGPLLLQGFQVPGQMPPILGFHRGHMHHAPHVTFTLLIAHQHAQQLPHVQPIALRSTLTTIDCNGGGIDHLVGEPLRLQKAMQPEAFTTRFITTHHWCGFRQAKASFGLGDVLEHARLMTRCDSALTRLLTMPRGETELPGFFTQFKGHKQDTLCGGIMLIVGRCGHELSPPWGKGLELWKRSLRAIRWSKGNNSFRADREVMMDLATQWP